MLSVIQQVNMMNQTIFQFFHWYYSPEGNLWKHAAEEAGRLADMGITHVWLPPAYKSAWGVAEAGYAVYDLYDLGEFEQQGTVRTRYGTKEEYLEAIRALQTNNMQVLADVVLNHRTGGDETEKVLAQKVQDHNRLEAVDGPYEVEAHTKFLCPGRNGKYSEYIWDWHSFTGFCEDNTIHIIHSDYSNGKWEDVLEDEFGNYDYLMGCDVEFRNPNVREELKRWGIWYVEQTGVDGFRLDALKHIEPTFYPEWLDHLNNHFKKDFYTIGEFWKNDVNYLLRYLDAVNNRIRLVDVPIHFNFYEASMRGKDYDMRQIFDNTLVQKRPEMAITFVDNHDTQPLQALQSTVEFWFKPIAYSLILLREQGTPCVFYPAMYEAKYFDKKGEEEIYVELNKIPGLEEQIRLRRHVAYGKQNDYFDHGNVVGWTREGDEEHELSGCAVLISNSEDGHKTMHIGQKHAGKVFVDRIGGRAEKITIDENGNAEFLVNGGSVSVWVREDKK
jgi:alpha-amylase